MVIYTIDGNIGCGKTTILNYLHKHKNIQIDLEPVDKWKPFLDNVYINKTGYFNLQIKVWRASSVRLSSLPTCRSQRSCYVRNAAYWLKDNGYYEQSI